MLLQTEIQAAIKLLNNNKLIILPTDTIHGISAIVAEGNEARINSIKGSPLNKPLIILISSIEQAKSFVTVDKVFLDNIKTEEPTTVIYSKANEVKTYALRLVTKTDIKEIIDSVGPIYSTSVNRSTESILSKFDELSQFSEQISHVFYDEELDTNPSKIVDLRDFSKKR